MSTTNTPRYTLDDPNAEFPAIKMADGRLYTSEHVELMAEEDYH